MTSSSDSMAATSVVSVGSLPSSNTEDWAKSVGKNPSVVRFKLKPISDLFKSEWVNDIPLVSGVESGDKLRAVTLKGYFDDVLDNYCRVMLGEDCGAVVEEDKGCGINGFCSPKQVCVNDKSVDEGYKCQDSESENDALIFNFQIQDLLKIRMPCWLDSGRLQRRLHLLCLPADELVCSQSFLSETN